MGYDDVGIGGALLDGGGETLDDLAGVGTQVVHAQHSITRVLITHDLRCAHGPAACEALQASPTTKAIPAANRMNLSEVPLSTGLARGPALRRHRVL